MLKLSFDNPIRYDFSSDKQFERGEKHVTRRYGKSVLILMRRGVLRFSENGVPIELTAGEYYIQRAGLYQQGLLDNELPNYFFIHFDGEFTENGVLPIRGTFDILRAEEIISKIKLLGGGATRLEYEKHFYELLLLLKRSSALPAAHETIRAYILDNFDKALSLDELAAKSGVTPNHVINVFKRAYFVTPHRFLTEYRLKRATELMISSDLPLLDVAISVGFSDYSAFYKLFRRKTGVSPERYRKKITAEKE